MSKKHFLALLLVLCLTFALVACGTEHALPGAGTEPTDNSEQPTQSTQTEPSQPANQETEPTQPANPGSNTQTPNPDPTPDPEPDPAPAPTTEMGTVKVNESLNIRSGPGTNYEIVGTLRNGDRVEILEQKVAGSMTWGKITQGWISLDYVVLDSDVPEPGSLTYEEYKALSTEEQVAYFKTFESGAAFNAWYNQAKAEWDAKQDKEITNGNITLD